MHFQIRNSLLIAIILGLNVSVAHAVTTTGNNFTMLDGTGGATGGTNDVVFVWDGTFKTSVVTDNTNNASLSSVTPFFGVPWYAHHVNVYGPGTYEFDVSCSAGNPTCGDGGTDQYTLVIPAGYAGAHMLFDWGSTSNIDVVQLWKPNDSWNATKLSTSTTRDLFNIASPNPNSNTGDTIWAFVSIDTPIDADVRHGTAMIDGPFQGFSANFSINAVPVPAAVWLFGSGLLGLMGMTKRKKKNA